MLPRFLRQLRVSRYQICVDNPVGRTRGVPEGFAAASKGPAFFGQDGSFDGAIIIPAVGR